jgi:hypothetical protein
MPAKYLVRFDDICPTMNWTVWDRIEPILVKRGIKPILAVVPDNLDPKLRVADVRDDFCQRVRDWQAAGWFIALHGYQHTYVTKDAGILGINAYSEFAGLPYDIQCEKLTKAVAIFERHHVRVDGWVAPAHSFDEITVRILLELGIEVISDGFYARPVKYLGAKWLPQQMWQFRNLPFGLWTVCFHLNKFTDVNIEQLQQDIETYGPAITSVERVLMDESTKKRNALDRAFNSAWLTTLRWKMQLKRRRVV